LLPPLSRNRNCHGQHGHGWAIFTKFKKYATRQQSTVLKLYGPLVGIIVLLILVPQDCWLVAVLDQNERCYGWWDLQRFQSSLTGQFNKQIINFDDKPAVAINGML
jgi:hypothetical protein